MRALCRAANHFRPPSTSRSRPAPAKPAASEVVRGTDNRSAARRNRARSFACARPERPRAGGLGAQGHGGSERDRPSSGGAPSRFTATCSQRRRRRRSAAHRRRGRRDAERAEAVVISAPQAARPRREARGQHPQVLPRSLASPHEAADQFPLAWSAIQLIPTRFGYLNWSTYNTK